ncbi:MAG: polysaccharide biosynthesis/export family protein [Phycisphaerales bacterium]|nr:MAG: polysaccharide biosynthesis/export family protein [Phycisphaerales bacterium]
MPQVERNVTMLYARFLTGTILLLVAIGLSGCFSSNPEDIKAFMMPQKVDVSTDTYILQPPDDIEVHCSSVPEINLMTQQIRPDGKVSFEAIGEIDAAGKTPAQVANILRAKVLELYQIEGDHPIDVRVVGFRSKRYYVFGQVGSPGAQVYSGRDTVMGALALAGGPTVLAWVERIQVIRPSHDENVKAKIFEINFDRMAAHGEASKDVLLQEGDVIYVPPTILAAAAMKIEEVIRPIARAFAGYYLTTRPEATPAGAGFGSAGF